ncbi:MAG: PilN domain-containing protein [Chthonomonas sp.]|nr:PilN domain-containing protein [Chthonomonas sp.]
MPYINLIHDYCALRKKQEQKAKTALIALLSVSAVSVVGMGTLLIMRENVRGQAAAVKAVIARIQPIMNDIDASKKQMSVLGPKLTSLQDAQSITRHWTNALSHFSKNVPGGVWLTAIKSQQKAKDGNVEVTLNGVSLKQEGVGDLMLRMKGLKDFTDVQLKFTQEDRNPDLSTIRYEVLAKLPGTAAGSADPKKPAKISDRRKDEKEATS